MLHFSFNKGIHKRTHTINRSRTEEQGAVSANNSNTVSQALRQEMTPLVCDTHKKLTLSAFRVHEKNKTQWNQGEREMLRVNYI